ncbi:MAG TPA: Crp/Fnr family transcriptional regulator [Thermoanaerobaculia bacterium]|nr:Crp/Fnr family transcriptional regulator [Thermoanaerobaculia bacterium]
MEIATLLHLDAHMVTLASRQTELQRLEGSRFDLMVAEVADGADPAAMAEAAKRLATPWLACSASDPAATTAAYQAGALAVLPRDTPPDVVLRTVARLLATLAPKPVTGGAAPARHRWQRHYRAGERILLDAESTLEVQSGVVALTVIHDDGAEVLLGLYGPGQVLAGHPEDSCCIQLYAHTETKVRIQPWPESARLPLLPERLRDRLRHMEAWAAMQARPQIEQRLLGILSLLAEQFGRVTPQGAVIDVRITHSQLASAVGATRATVTRRVGLLRRRGLLTVIGSGSGERYCLPHWEEQRHSSAAG